MENNASLAGVLTKLHAMACGTARMHSSIRELWHWLLAVWGYFTVIGSQQGRERERKEECPNLRQKNGDSAPLPHHIPSRYISTASYVTAVRLLDDLYPRTNIKNEREGHEEPSRRHCATTSRRAGRGGSPARRSWKGYKRRTAPTDAKPFKNVTVSHISYAGNTLPVK